MTWAFGNVTNLPDNGVNDDFVIVYRAQVIDEVFALNDLSIPLNNTVTMTYDTATGSVSQSDGDTVITALQPQLAVSKSSIGRRQQHRTRRHRDLHGRRFEFRQRSRL